MSITEVKLCEKMEIDELHIAQLLMDEYVLKMLSGMNGTPKSARELSFNYNLPLASTYRKIKEMEAVGLVKCEGKLLTQEGKRYKAYVSQLVDMNVSYNSKTMFIHIHLKWKEPVDIKLDLTNGQLFR